MSHGTTQIIQKNLDYSPSKKEENKAEKKASWFSRITSIPATIVNFFRANKRDNDNKETQPEMGCTSRKRKIEHYFQNNTENVPDDEDFDCETASKKIKIADKTLVDKEWEAVHFSERHSYHKPENSNNERLFSDYLSSPNIKPKQIDYTDPFAARPSHPDKINYH